MGEVVRSNFGITDAEAKKDHDGRLSRLHAGWERFDEYEKAQKAVTTTHEELENFWSAPFPIEERHLEAWLVYSGLGEHGTAL